MILEDEPLEPLAPTCGEGDAGGPRMSGKRRKPPSKAARPAGEERARVFTAARRREPAGPSPSGDSRRPGHRSNASNGHSGVWGRAPAERLSGSARRAPSYQPPSPAARSCHVPLTRVPAPGRR